MQIVQFSQIKDELISDMRRYMLIPIIGSGFTRGCTAYHGTVPSGKDYKEYMIQQIASKINLSDDELNQLKNDSFSDVSEVYHKIIPVQVQKEYLKANFTRVKLENCKIKFLESDWPYIYTLNIDDAIENNSPYSHIVYANRQVENGIFDDFACVIKLHGDVSEMLTYQDTKSEVFTQKQYIDSLRSNASLLGKLHHDSTYQNLIFIGCSLDDEIDLLASSRETGADAAKYFCTTKEPSILEKLKYEKYGITHCIVFPTFSDIYEKLAEIGQEAKKISIDDLDEYKRFSIKTLPESYEANKPYLFFGKSLIDKDHTLSIPYFFIERKVTESIFKNLALYPLQILVGYGCSGKSYVLTDLATRIKSKDVFLFETKDRVTEQAFQELTIRKNCTILADDAFFSEKQIEYFIANTPILKRNGVSVVIAVDKHNKMINGLLKLYELQKTIQSGDIPIISVSNRLDHDECQKISLLLTTATIGIFKETDTIVDNIINLSRDLSEKNRYTAISPRVQTIPELAALIALATEKKLYSTRAITLQVSDELFLQCKACAPLIDQESTWSFETDFNDNAPIKYVVNAEYWLCYQLENFSKREENHEKIVAAYKYIVAHIIAQERGPSLLKGNKDNSYGQYILFDDINRIFCSGKSSSERGLELIRKIYEGLNSLLSADPNYMHQRAKCYIKSAYFERKEDQKEAYFDKAFRDANVAFQVFDNRYDQFHNEKIRISADHVIYTKALILCHRCFMHHYTEIDENTAAVQMLHDALSSPYNTYAFAKSDSLNYRNVIAKIVYETVADRSLVSPSVHTDLEDLFRMLSA